MHEGFAGDRAQVLFDLARLVEADIPADSQVGQAIARLALAIQDMLVHRCRCEHDELGPDVGRWSV